MPFHSYRRNIDEDLRRLRNRHIAAGSISDEDLEKLELVYRRSGLYRCSCTESCGERCLEAVTDDAPRSPSYRVADLICNKCLDHNWPHHENCFCELCQVPLYSASQYDPKYIELHAHHTAWDPRLSGINIDWDWWNVLVRLAAEDFEEQAGVKIILEGRSGRHVCVEDTLENRQRYDELEQLALRLEEGFIKSFILDEG